MKKKIRIMAAGDFHGSRDLAEKISKKAEEKNADLVILAGDIAGFGGESSKVLEPFSKRGQKVAFIPGNWDSFEDYQIFKEHAKSIHHYYISYGDVGILGIGNPDWKMELDELDFAAVEGIFKKMKPKRKILVSHLHIAGTPAEFSGVPGDAVLRRIVEKFKPNLVISGHIHEAEGIEGKIGKTKFIQVGRRGRIIEL